MVNSKMIWNQVELVIRSIYRQRSVDYADDSTTSSRFDAGLIRLDMDRWACTDINFAQTGQATSSDNISNHRSECLFSVTLRSNGASDRMQWKRTNRSTDYLGEKEGKETKAVDSNQSHQVLYSKHKIESCCRQNTVSNRAVSTRSTRRSSRAPRDVAERNGVSSGYLVWRQSSCHCLFAKDNVENFTVAQPGWD